MGDSERILVLWNPSAGSADRADAVLQQLRGWPDVEIQEPEDRDAARRMIEAAGDRYRLVVAAGGDGTVNAVTTALVETQLPTPMAVLPLGTGNDLSRTLEIPFEPEGCLRLLREGVPLQMDVAEITTADGKTSISSNMITAGNSGKFLENMSKEIKARWGPFAYVRGVVDVLQTLESFNVRVYCDGQPWKSGPLFNLFVANGKTSGGGMTVSPHAELNDGLLEVVLIREGEVTDLAALTAEYLLADYLNHDLVEYRQARRIRIEADEPLPVTCDGDLIGETPLEIQIRPRALTVLHPPSTPET